MHPLVAGMMNLFDGFRHAYGNYSATLAPVETGGPKIKGRAVSVPQDVLPLNWELHIQGKVGLGIIPINEHSEVKFAAIDIDAYGGIVEKVNQRIQELKLPLVVCRTKSGGVHAYLFLSAFVPAAPVYQRLREFAAHLGYGNAEIFPKQTKIVAERGDIGQWINMPYFNAGDTERYALNAAGEKLGLHEFIDYAGRRAVTLPELAAIDLVSADRLPGGPPCLNHLVAMGFPEGTRNQGLFNLGVYAKKKFPETWQAEVEKFNTEFLSPPLGGGELLGVIKSLNKKDFFYTCKAAPICNFCNMPECRKRDFGIGNGDTGLPKFGSLSKLLTEPVIWFLEVEGGGRLELSTDDLQNQRRFQHRCMAALNVMPSLIKGEAWQELIQGLLEHVTVIEMPLDLTPAGILRRHLEEFCNGRVQAAALEEILAGKPYTDDGYTSFRMSDFLDYLERRRYKELPMSEIGMWMREWRAEKKFLRIKGKGMTLTVIPSFTNQQTEKLAVPPGGPEKSPF